MEKKVGIVSCYFKHNYGSMLQAYATKRILDNNNIKNETINVDYNTDFSKGKKKYYLSQLFNYKFIKSKFGMIKLKFDKKIIRGLGKNISIRDNKYKEFKKEFNLSNPVQTYKELEKMTEEKYSDIILGSDQLWLPVNVVADYYTLNWVPDDVNKISYATSFGISEIPKKYDQQYYKFLKRINHLSVREESGVKILNSYKIESKLVCDPTILLSKDEWKKEAVEERVVKDKYILCYLLGNNKEHRNFAKRLKEETGLKVVSLNHADEYVKYSDEIADIVPYDIGPREWINLIENAEYVCTDSFHGTVFSLLFNKLFFDFRRYKNKSKMSTNSRIDSLLHLAGVSSERILDGTENVKDVLKYTIDYSKVNKKLEDIRNDSKNWLLNSLTYKKVEDNDKFIKIEDKTMCSGCTACKSNCPQNAINMCEDEEGFLYPIVDNSKCINCGICKKICPIINKKETKQFEQRGYIFQNCNEEERLESTSGGFYTAIGKYIIKNNGSVYGVALDGNFEVKHIRIEKEKNLEQFRNSKYVQSNPNETFRQVKEDLESNRLVCYSGTACQIEGLKAFLEKDYNNLITVDVICRAVPSPLLWKKYIEYKNKNNDITKVKFREKLYGYKYSNLTMRSSNKLIYHNGIDKDPYLRAFFSNIACRPSCYNCKFKEQLHKADFTIWDCFDVEKYDCAFDDDKGTTKVLLNSEKAIGIFFELAKNNKVKEIECDKLVSNFHQMFNSIKYNVKREEFFRKINEKPIEIVLNEYFPNKIKNKVEKILEK